MAGKKSGQGTRRKVSPGQRKSNPNKSSIRRHISPRNLTPRSQSARSRALHVLSTFAARRNAEKN